MNVAAKIQNNEYKNKDAYPTKPAKPATPMLAGNPTPENIKKYAAENAEYATKLEKYADDLIVYNQAKAVWQEKQRELDNQMEKDLAIEFGFEVSPRLHKLVYERAYAEGHANGNSEIYNYYSQLADFVHGAITAHNEDRENYTNKKD